MVEEERDAGEEINAESDEVSAVWNILTPEQKKYFLKLSEKTEENMRYIG
jgi:hypothetical protein